MNMPNKESDVEWWEYDEDDTFVSDKCSQQQALRYTHRSQCFLYQL